MQGPSKKISASMTGVTLAFPLKSLKLLLQTLPIGYCDNSKKHQLMLKLCLAPQQLVGLSSVLIHESYGDSAYLPTLYL